MAKIKSFSVGNGDMFYIKHDSDNFTIIDCNLTTDKAKQKCILTEIKEYNSQKTITRFISTHPDEDHILGLKKLDEEIEILNFYCVENEAKKEDETEDFICYKQLRDNKEKAFYISKGCERKWMNLDSEESDSEKRKSSGIDILWPDKTDKDFQKELQNTKEGESPNNISPIIKYTENNATVLWMGDLETDFMKKIEQKVYLPKVDILFAPHHGRKSGTIPTEWLEKMDPDVIIIGEAPSENINYYQKYNTITQNSAGDIIFDLKDDRVDIFCSKKSYSVDFLEDKKIDRDNTNGKYYLGSLFL